MDEAELIGTVTVKSSAAFGGFYRPDASKPVGTCSKLVAVIVEQGVLGNQPALGRIEFIDAMRSGQKSFEQRGLAVFVKVCLRLGDRAC